MGDVDLTGTIKGSDFSFSFASDAQGQQFKVTYQGTVTKDSLLYIGDGRKPCSFRSDFRNDRRFFASSCICTEKVS